MDIEYLLFLQGLRETAPAWLNAFFTVLSELTTGPLPFVFPALLFWCVSKDAGSYLFVSLGLGRALNALVKNTACVYRPWVRDARVQSSLMATATGYSFPSGHTTTAVAIYGGTGVLLKKKTGKTWLLLLCFVPAVLTGFSRNWVGAHTPQDVVVGFVLTVAVLYAADRLMAWLRAHPEKDVVTVLVLCGAAALLLVYVTVKPYPLDYAADGTLLVDPAKMTRDAFGNVGTLVGFLLAWLGERRLVRFTIDDRSTACRIARGAVGCVVAAAVYLALVPTLQEVITQPHLRKFIGTFTYTFMFIFVYPAAFTFVERRFLKQS